MNERTVFFLDASFAPAAIRDDAIALEYSERFCGAGEFECVLPAAGDLPPSDGYVMCGGGLIYAVERVRRDSAAGTVTLTGRGLLSLLSRRIVPCDLAFFLSPEECVRRLAQTYAAAALPAELVVTRDAASDERWLVVEGGGVLECLLRLAASVSKGISLTYDAARERFVLDVFSGTDRRFGNSAGNDALFLSERFGTLADAVETTDLSRYVNRVTVLGGTSPEGDELSVTVDAADYDFPDGVDDSEAPLREGFVRSALAVSLYTSDTGSGTIFDRVGYLAALRERGREELLLRRPARTLTARLIGDAAKLAKVGDVCSAAIPGSDVSAAQLVRRTVRFRNDKLTTLAELTEMSDAGE